MILFYLFRSGKKLPNLDPAFFGGAPAAVPQAAMPPVNVKQERFEQYQQQNQVGQVPYEQQAPQVATQPPMSQQQQQIPTTNFPKTLQALPGNYNCI